MNGYDNYETWVVALWLENEEGSYRYWIEQAKEAEGVDDLASRLQEYIQECLDDLDARCGWLADIVEAAVGQIDCYAIAERFMEGLEA